ncbi:hypothetical protein NEPAR06_0542 [Nematocida parisii]|uniref:uncharacterized protein n=1 Tax=Nematocida parisii (strain ERTm1 / ATCC PRA-289) TaxID=881290 RepID=UPI000264B4C6|nr:uncharacterized protein NEPG_01839 [Nematocida parisii ERTm1]KAI5126317.1 hypothetical protein NEPAR08_0388 [Nematocida parisii]EIJ93497.1 hypothetical protein NEPG_01839 [Nematocida parisii ERTm1]KAI5127184.1 hypothetical protein NEPAR03_0851 [Nematocida parisii]KAI5140098.1 hypothetical protein NEPAR04_0072 [Nematocida parisii]KAI5153548.1 hypothetical protein NEPAR06_0542 [Nematocida parisii]|eukprot:XP_013059667.1 hypothetical protein NEPG_01839 [Nematocida parisii ERTm1]
MDRTQEFKKDVAATGITQLSNTIEESSITGFLSITKELRISLNSCYTSLINRRAYDYTEIENMIKSLVKESTKATELIEPENECKYTNGIISNIKAIVKRTEIKLEERKSKKIQSSLNIALEPEKSSSVVRPKPVMLQVLHEENERILERVRCTEREVAQIRRRVSEIDTLQRLITQELYVQDERIDVILHNTAAASVDVKISRTYIRNAGAKKKVAKRFISLLIMILSFVLLMLHYLNK